MNRQYILHFDGSCKPNPGEMQIGIYIYNQHDNNEKYYITKKLGKGTNNIAEFSACLYGIKYIKYILNCNNIIIYGDSNLAINVINKYWQAKQDYLIKIANIIHHELKDITYIATWIPREQNEIANDISINKLEYKIIEL